MTKDQAERLKTLRAGEIMIPLEQYPHVCDTCTLREAIAEMEKAQLEVNGRRSLPRLLLVFDQDKQLVGLVRRRDLLRGLEPRFLRGEHADYPRRLFEVDIDPNLLELSSDSLVEGMRGRSEHTVRDVMVADIVTIDYDDHVMKAIHEIVSRNITALPVLREGRVVGIVRTVELFHEVAKLVV
jgi:CBS domain-containing protein